MFCSNCGKLVVSSSDFCSACGENIAVQNEIAAGVPLGFSCMINDTAVRKQLEKNKKATGVFAILLVLAPLVVSFAISLNDGDFDNVLYGGIISGVFLIFNLIFTVKKKLEKQWDGVVIDKYTKSSSKNDAHNSTYTAYIVVIRKENGHIKKIEEREYNRSYYDYLQIGDRVRYHPQFNCYFEKYDKRNDRYAICPICGRKNDIKLDSCTRCKVPIIK